MAIQQKILTYILLSFILFSFIKSETDKATFKKGEFHKNYNIEEILTVSIEGIDDSYLKILVEGKDENIINHVISYYQDKNIIERKQLSQSARNTSIMWLNKEQTEKDFYITVECAEYPCPFDLTLEQTNEAELNLNEQYTYYVTKDNTKMKFKLNFIEEYKVNDKKDPYVSVWARGNKNIEAVLKGGDFQKPSSFIYYDITYDDFKKGDYYLTITGEIGDLINVGLILYRECVSNFCISDFYLENGEEVTSYFEVPASETYQVKDKLELSLGYFYDFNNRLKSAAVLNYGNIGVEGQGDLFYSYQYLTTTVYDGFGNNKYSPLLDGIYTIKQIQEGTTIGLIPMKPKDDFAFLTYEILPIGGDIEVSIYECDSYPFCHLNADNINTKKLTKIENFQSYYYTYKNDEWDDNISPITKKQKMLLITCKNGININKLNNVRICSASINMKTDSKEINNTDFHLSLPPYQRFIRKNNKDVYFLKGRKNPIHLYIEKTAGDISIEIDPKPKEIEKKNFYVIEKETDTYITITGLENSVYSINDNYLYEDIENVFLIGYNYLFKLGGDMSINFLPQERLHNVESYKDIQRNYDFLLNIHPLNCDIKIEKYNFIGRVDKTVELKSDNYYQETFSALKFNDLKITNNGNKDDCLFYLSSYNKQDIMYSSYNNGIVVDNKKPQTFIFNENNNQIYLSFPYVEFKNNVNIDFEQIESSNKYTVSIKVNENDLTNKEKTFNGEKANILLTSEEIKDNCDSEFICKIIIKVESDDKDTESHLQITFRSIKNENDDSDDNNDSDDYNDSDDNNDSDNNKDSDKNHNNDNKNEEDDDDDDDKKKALILIFSILGVVIAIAIAVGLFYYFKIYTRNKDLSNAVNQISFKDNDKNNDDDEIGDSLLD